MEHIHGIPKVNSEWRAVKNICYLETGKGPDTSYDSLVFPVREKDAFGVTRLRLLLHEHHHGKPKVILNGVRCGISTILIIRACVYALGGVIGRGAFRGGDPSFVTSVTCFDGRDNGRTSGSQEVIRMHSRRVLHFAE